MTGRGLKARVIVRSFAAFPRDRCAEAVEVRQVRGPPEPPGLRDHRRSHGASYAPNMNRR